MNFETMFNFHQIMFYIIGGITAFIFIFVFVLFLSPKLRGKMMSNQVKALRHMTDHSKEDFTKIKTNLEETGIKAKQEILENNYDILKDLNIQEAEIKTEAIKKTINAIKEGLDTGSQFCKHCGKIIDNDSKYCKHCGKEQ